MAQPSGSTTPVASPVSVIGPQFCSPCLVDLSITIKCLSGSLVIKDVNSNVLLKTNGGRVLLDAAGNPIVNFRQKMTSTRWRVFRGESKDARDLLFSVKSVSLFLYKSKLNVFLANNTTEEVCDFKIKKRGWGLSCVIYAGESSKIVAEVHSKDKYVVTVHPNIDYAFIVSLIVILDNINTD